MKYNVFQQQKDFNNRKGLRRVTLTFCTLTRFPDTVTGGGTEKPIKTYSDTISQGRNFTWAGSRNYM